MNKAKKGDWKVDIGACRKTVQQIKKETLLL